jgi:uncharacterized NAD(P)/FAD-binding protein YdhS/predicted metal-dependent enzyme (double-stranded beta helix superfamily)
MVLDPVTDNPVGQGTQVLLDILSELDARTEPVSISELEEILRGLTLERADVAPWVQFDGKIYRRNLIRQSANYTALLLCWRCGQRTPIHNHKGSACAVKVIHGVASEIQFEHGPNDMVYPTGSRHYQAGEVFSSFDVDTHQMVNLQADPHDLITLHVYSPPLKEMEFVAMQETTLANHDADLLGPVMAYWRKDAPPISTAVDDGGRVSVVIVGGGCSGSLTATQLLRQAVRPNLDITIVEPRDRVARGAAYSTMSPHHLLNVPAGNMSVFPDQPDHFVTWLGEQGHAYTKADFVPRRIFGEYIDAVLSRAADTKRSGDRFRVIPSRVVATQPDGHHRWRVEMENVQSLLSDVVVLAIGNQPPADKVASVQGASRIIENPWLETVPEELAKSPHILLVGSGLTAVDFIYHLTLAGYEGKFTTISRRGQLPLGHRHVPHILPPAELFGSELPLSKKLRLFREAAQAIEAEGGDWRSLMEGLRPRVQELWHALNARQQGQFLRHLRRTWDQHRHRIAQEMEAVLVRMQAEGRLNVIAGRVDSVTEIEASVQASYVAADGGSQVLQADVAIMCTGPSDRIERRRDALTQSLLASGIAMPDRHSMGFSTNSGAFLLNPRGETQAGLYAIGPLRKGSLWESTALREIRVQAQEVAEHIVTSLSAFGIGL